MTFIAPPNLTDSSIQGGYSAALVVPRAIVTIGNRITTAIGAPGLTGDAATVQHMPSGGSGAPVPWHAILPVPVKAVWAQGRVLLASAIASLKGSR